MVLQAQQVHKVTKAWLVQQVRQDPLVLQVQTVFKVKLVLSERLEPQA